MLLRGMKKECWRGGKVERWGRWGWWWVEFMAKTFNSAILIGLSSTHDAEEMGNRPLMALTVSLVKE